MVDNDRTEQWALGSGICSKFGGIAPVTERGDVVLDIFAGSNTTGVLKNSAGEPLTGVWLPLTS